MKRNKITTGLGIVIVGLMAATGCSSDAEGGEDTQEDVSLRFAWWGSDTRHQATQEIIDLFEEENPGITVEAQFGEWSNYWDQIATQTAGGNAPDIIQMDEMYVREYADRNALLDLSDVDTSELEDAAVDAGRTEDGLYAISLGVIALGTIVNADLLEEAGIDMPDDESWTWDDFAEISAQVSSDLDGVYGAGELVGAPMGLQVWLRQHDKDLFDDSGELALSTDDARDYLQFTLDLHEDADYPSADYISESQGLGPEDSAVGTNEAAMGFRWATQVIAQTSASGSDLQVLRLPSEEGSAEANGDWIKGSMFLSAAAGTDHPEEAKQFIDFFVNSQEAGEINGMERGLPANLEIRQSVLEEIEGPELAAAEFVEEVEQSGAGTTPVPPPGFGTFQEIIDRHLLELLFDRMTVDEAAEGMVAELEAEVS